MASSLIHERTLLISPTLAATIGLVRPELGIVVEGVDALIAKPGALKESLLGMSFLRRLRSYEFSGDFLTMRG